MLKKVLLPGLVLPFLLVFPLQAQEPPAPADDEALIQLIKTAGNSEDYPEADALVLFDRTRVTMEESGLAHIETRYLVKILTENGVDDHLCLRFDYDPASNTIEIRKVRLLRQNGDILDLSGESVRDLPQPQSWIMWGPRMKIVKIPRFSPGDAIEYETYKKGFMIAYLGESGDEGGDEKFIPPMRGHFYDVILFAGSLPMKQKYYRLATPRNKPAQFEMYNGEVSAYVTFNEHENIYTFWKKDIEAFHSEPRAPDLSDLIPKVVLATVPSWEEKSRWFYHTNEPVFPADEAITRKVREITRGLKTEEEKRAALLHWAAQEIRYSGITMGKGEGYTIHPSTMSFNDRCGVCKDKAGMLVTLLRVAGYTAYPAMTMAGSRVERIPADQFNHCVVALKEADGSYTMLDPTWAVFSRELWSSAESEQNYVIGSPEGEGLSITPLSPAENNVLEIDAVSELDDAGNLTGTITLSGRGYQDQRLRRLFVHGAPGPDVKSLFEHLAANIAPQAEITDLQAHYGDMLDFSRPVTMTFSYVIPDYALFAGDRMVFTAPTAHHFIDYAGIAPYLNATETASRSQPLMLWCTRMVKVREKIKIPDQYRVKSLPEKISLDREVASLSTAYSKKKGYIEFTEDLALHLRTYPENRYGDLKEVIDTVRELPEKTVIVEKVSS